MLLNKGKIVCLVFGGIMKSHSACLDRIDIFMATDTGSVMQTCVTMNSILKNTTIDRKLAFYIFSSKVPKADKAKIDSLKHIRPFDLRWIKFKESYISTLKTYWYNRDIYAKFLIPYICNLNKCIWVSNSILMVGDIANWWDINLENDLFGAVAQIRSFEYQPILIDDGIMLLNLKGLRRCCSLEDMIEITKKGQGGGCFLPRNTYLKLAGLRFKLLPTSYNILESYVPDSPEKSSLMQREIAKYLSRPLTYNYEIDIKPWNTLKEHWVESKRSTYLYNLWFSYKETSPYAQL